MATNVHAAVTVIDVEYQPGFLARVYQPRGSGPFPLLLDVHGGAWNMGDRLGNARLDEEIGTSGVVVAAIDFRQPPVAGYPASIADTNLGLRWLKAHASDFHGATGSLGVLGTSSGGHMAMLSALRPRDPRYAALGHIEGDASVNYAILCWPILDPLARYEMAKQVGRTELVTMHDAYWGNSEAMEEGNPTRILERGEPVETPPVLILQGTNDANVTPDMADRFATAYRQRGGQVELVKFEGMPHTFISQKPDEPASRQATERIIAFVKERA